MILQRMAVFLLLAGLGFAQSCQAGTQRDRGTRYLRFSLGDREAYGILEGDRVRELKGDLFGTWEKTETTHALAEVRILVPSGNPSKVLALAGNYKSHLADAEPSPHPQPFIKLPSSLLPHGGEIVQPADTDPVHYEAEVVVVIGKRARNVSEEAALDHVLGITCGNDISARTWQKGDVQWWRAKGADTFSPTGPYILSGVDYSQLKIVLKLNGEVRQQGQPLRHDSRDTRNRQLYQQVRDPGARRPHLHRHPRNHQGNAAGRRGHGGNRGCRSPREPGGRRQALRRLT